MDAKIAYCGIYCGACGIFLATESNELEELSKELKIPVTYLACKGCRSDTNNLCCMNCGIKRCCGHKNINSCNECNEFPCANLKKLDQRHLRDDNVSLIENLVRIRKIGAEQWLKEQEDKWRCPGCGGNICVMDKECYDCGCKID